VVARLRGRPSDAAVTHVCNLVMSARPLFGLAEAAPATVRKNARKSAQPAAVVQTDHAAAAEARQPEEATP
jgi:hypothetical protein